MTTPQKLATAKRETMVALSEQEYQSWRHQPITAGYLQYLEDMLAFYREAVVDILEAGQFNAGDTHPDRNPDCLRGQIIMLRQLHGLGLENIKSFYVKEEDA